MDGRLVYGILLISTSRTFDLIGRHRDIGGVGEAANKGSGLATGSILEVQQEVGANAINPFLSGIRARNRLVFEDYHSDMDRVGV